MFMVLPYDTSHFESSQTSSDERRHCQVDPDLKTKQIDLGNESVRCYVTYGLPL